MNVSQARGMAIINVVAVAALFVPGGNVVSGMIRGFGFGWLSGTVVDVITQGIAEHGPDIVEDIRCWLNERQAAEPTAEELEAFLTRAACAGDHAAHA